MVRTFVISDTHIAHKNIILYENRPFRDIVEMQQTITKNWNNIVAKDDKVYHLGDVCFGNKEIAREFVSNLNGKKYLIMGNHDRSHPPRWWVECGFYWVSANPIIYKGFYVLSHEPIYINSWIPMINVHGHLHSKKMVGDQYVNISCECLNYTPIDFEEIKLDKARLLTEIKQKLPEEVPEGGRYAH